MIFLSNHYKALVEKTHFFLATITDECSQRSARNGRTVASIIFVKHTQYRSQNVVDSHVIRHLPGKTSKNVIVECGILQLFMRKRAQNINRNRPKVEK